MKILLIANHYAVASGRYMTDAFKRLGHDVRHVGPAHGRSIWGMDVDAKYVWTPDEIEIGWAPDLCVYADSDMSLLTLDHYAGDAPIVVCGVDSHVRRYDGYYGFSHYFLSHKGVCLAPWNDAIMTHLPCAYDPTLFTPSPIPYAEREYDVAMIGVMYPQRWALVNELRAAGLKVLAGTGLIYDQYVAAYHNARISLCVSAAGDVAQRVFETAAMGCLVVSDECADLKRLQVAGIYQYHDTTDLISFINVALNDSESTQRLIAQSLEWVRPHSWDARAQIIVDWLQKRQAGEVTHGIQL